MNKIKKFLLKNNLWHFIEPIMLKLRGINEEDKIRELVKTYTGFINPGDLVFDIGANKGIYSLAFYRLGGYYC